MITILLDMDGTIVDTMTSLGWAAYYPEYRSPKTEKRYEHADFTEYGFTNFSRKEREKLYNAFTSPGVFRKAAAYPNAVESVLSLLSRPEEFKIKFVSHFMPDWTLAYAEKVEWLRQEFNTDINRDLIICKDRTNIVWDVLVDDCLDNVFGCESLYNRYILVPDRSWNQGSLPDNAIRCFGWQEIKQHIIRISDDIRYLNGPRMPEM